MSEIKEEFKYSFFDSTNLVLVVAFDGKMMAQSTAKLECCKSELESRKDLKLVAFHFSSVVGISDDAISIFTLMQRMLRERKCSVAICGLSPVLRDKLLKIGVIRSREIHENLKSGIESYISTLVSVKKAA